MKNTLLPLLSILLSVSSAWAEPPKAVLKVAGGSKTEVTVGDFIDVSGEESVGEFFSWRVEPATLEDGRPTFRLERGAEQQKSKSVELVQVPGKYRVFLFVSNEEGNDLKDIIVEVLPSSKKPEPAPEPVPEPTPKPTPTPVPDENGDIDPPNPPKPKEKLVFDLPSRIEMEVNSFAKIVATGNARQVKFLSLDKSLLSMPGDTSFERNLFAAVPGEFRMLGYAALNDDLSDPKTTMVVVHGPQPPPQPTPKPTPVPEPSPKPTPTPTPPIVTASKLWVVVVSDVLGNDPATSAVLGDTAFWKGLEVFGHQWRHEDIAEDRVKKKYDQILKANGGVPCVVIMDTNAKWLNKDPADLKMPATTAGMAALIAKYSGK